MIVFTRHAQSSMTKRDILENEVIETIDKGELIGIELGRTLHRRVFTQGYEWEGRNYPHKEVTVVYVVEGDLTVVITAIARYGRWEAQI